MDTLIALAVDMAVVFVLLVLALRWSERRKDRHAREAAERYLAHRAAWPHGVDDQGNRTWSYIETVKKTKQQRGPDGRLLPGGR